MLVGGLRVIFLIDEVRPGRQIAVGLWCFMFNNFMFQFDVSIEGVLGTVETIAVGVGTGQTLHDIFFAPSY